MCPLFSQEMARQHRESLERELIRGLPFATTHEHGYWNQAWDDGGFSFPLLDRPGFWHGRPAVSRQIRSAAFGHRLMLSLLLLCILMPLFGMTIGISLPILLTGSLFCLLVIVSCIVLGRV